MARRSDPQARRGYKATHRAKLRRDKIKVEYYPPGKLPTICRAGDVGLAAGDYRLAKKIAEIQDIAYEPQYAAFGHMFCVQQADGLVSEALEFGVEAEHISKYRNTFFAIVNVGEPLEVRSKAVEFGYSVLEARPRYSYETIALMYVQLRAAWLAQKLRMWRRPDNGFDFPITFQRTHTAICSGFGAEWLRSMGKVWDRGTGYVMPARVAYEYGAEFPLSEQLGEAS